MPFPIQPSKRTSAMAYCVWIAYYGATSGSLLLRQAHSWAPTSFSAAYRRNDASSSRLMFRFGTRMWSSYGGDDFGAGGAAASSVVDEFGRRIRTRRSEHNDWMDDDRDAGRRPSTPPRERRNTRKDDNHDSWSDGWDDFDPFRERPRRNTSSRSQQFKQSSRRDGGRDGRFHRRRDDGFHRSQSRRDRPPSSSFRSRNNSGSANKRPFQATEKDEAGGRINMKALEGSGFVHLYGLAPVLNALQAQKRGMDDSLNQDMYFDSEDDSLDDEFENDHSTNEKQKKKRKPEAQFRPYLFIQEQQRGGRTSEKARQAEKVEELAYKQGVPVARVDKGVLNTLAGNRPHQGFVLRCGKLEIESLSKLPVGTAGERPTLWLALDEVVDPQNLGALLRSAYFLGGGDSGRVGVLVCAKNSAPPSPVVSASSAGALEVMDKLYSTNNLPRTLAAAEGDGFRIIGASSSVPAGLQHDDDEEPGVQLFELQDLPPMGNIPTVLVLGSEGHGLRHLVARSCTEFVRISATESNHIQEDVEDYHGGHQGLGAIGVDSLNVSVTGGILLWHLLRGKMLL